MAHLSCFVIPGQPQHDIVRDKKIYRDSAVSDISPEMTTNLSTVLSASAENGLTHQDSYNLWKT